MVAQAPLVTARARSETVGCGREKGKLCLENDPRFTCGRKPVMIYDFYERVFVRRRVDEKETEGRID